ncbi:MAG: acetylglutamate kinase [Clostridia bacterium]
MNTAEQAKVLTRALPYIQKYIGKTIVIKYGGNAMKSEELKKAVIEDIVLLSCVGVRVVLVHGGGPEINEMLNRVGIESKFINGLRYTNADTIDIVQMVLCGKINKQLSALISEKGGKAMGISGLDSNLLIAEMIEEKDTDYGYVGNVIDVDTTIITKALDIGFIPVVATLAKDGNGQALNINADTAAAKIAAALKAERLLTLTDVAGVLTNSDDPSTLIEEIPVSDVNHLIKEGIIKGGMIPKIDCCVYAVREGVKNTAIIDGRVPHSILIEMLSDEGSGTMIF